MNIEKSKLEEIRKLDSFFYVLIDDVKKACDAWGIDPCPFTRRCYIRAVMAFIEGNTFRFKQSALWYHNNIVQIFNPEEIACLKEESVVLEGKGKPKAKPMRIPMLTNLRFALECYSKAFGKPYHLDPKNDDGWICIKKAIEKRDNITHPKNLNDFDVSDDDIKNFEQAAKYYRDITRPLIE